MSSCDAETLLSSAAASGFMGLSDGDKRAILLQLLCNMTGAISWTGDYTSGNVLIADGTQFVSQTPKTQLAVKSSDQNKANDTAYADDSELTVPVEAGGVYSVRSMLMFNYTRGAAGDAKFQWVAPAVNTYNEVVHRWAALTSPTSIAAEYLNLSTSGPNSFTFGQSGTNVRGKVFSELFVDCAASGNIALQWAQAILSAGNDCILTAGSWMEVTRIN